MVLQKLLDHPQFELSHLNVITHLYPEFVIQTKEPLDKIAYKYYQDHQYFVILAYINHIIDPENYDNTELIVPFKNDIDIVLSKIYEHLEDISNENS